LFAFENHRKESAEWCEFHCNCRSILDNDDLRSYSVNVFFGYDGGDDVDDGNEENWVLVDDGDVED
jgi:hypothetical protein